MPSGLFVASSNRGISSREFYSLSFPNGENSYVRKRLRNVINAFEIGRGRKERKEGRWRRRFDRRDVSTCTPQVFLRFIRLIEYGRRCKLRSSSFPFLLRVPLFENNSSAPRLESPYPEIFLPSFLPIKRNVTIIIPRLPEDVYIIR